LQQKCKNYQAAFTGLYAWISGHSFAIAIFLSNQAQRAYFVTLENDHAKILGFQKSFQWKESQLC